VDGKTFSNIGEPFTMAYGLITFQGIRYSLFSYNTRTGTESGFADFDSIQVQEPQPRGLSRPIPVGRQITLTAHSGSAEPQLGILRVVDRKLGRVALRSDKGFLSVDDAGAVSFQRGQPGNEQTFQWMETFTGELILMSLETNRYLRIDAATGALAADATGPLPSGDDGVRFKWSDAAR
jgi:hypothetical protein